MTKFRKRLLMGLVALGIGAGSFAAYADKPGCDHHMMGGGPAGFDGSGKSSERMNERMAKRQAELHNKLKLSAAQEPAWNTFVERMKPGASPVRPDRAEMEKLPAPERMEKMLSLMNQGEKKMAERTAAVKDFYAVLTPEQQKIFNEQFAIGRHRRFAS